MRGHLWRCPVYSRCSINARGPGPASALTAMVSCPSVAESQGFSLELEAQICGAGAGAGAGQVWCPPLGPDPSPWPNAQAVDSGGANLRYLVSIPPSPLSLPLPAATLSPPNLDALGLKTRGFIFKFKKFSFSSKLYMHIVLKIQQFYKIYYKSQLSLDLAPFP